MDMPTCGLPTRGLPTHGLDDSQMSPMTLSAAVTDRRSVTLVSLAETAEPIELPFGLRTWIGPENHVLAGGPDPPAERGNFEGGKGHPIVKCRNTVRSSVQKRLNQSRCRLGCGLRWSQGIMC